MDVVVRENIANSNMKNPPYVVGVVPVPDKHLEPVLYSDIQATKEFNQICEDIFVQKNKHKPADRKKTPKPVLYTLIAAAGFGIYKILKHLIFKK